MGTPIKDLTRLQHLARNCCLAAVIALGHGAVSADVFESLSGSGAVKRSLLTYDMLIGGTAAGSRIDLSGYALPANAAEPTQFFQGRLTLNNTAGSGSFAAIVDTYGDTSASDSPRKHLPPFAFEFIQTGSHIFPLQRGSIASTHPDWEFVLSPGRVWNEKGDHGYSRAALPFALQQRNANCTHNGVLSFLFKNDGSISKVAYQIASETCLYFKADLWGLLDANYSPYPIQNADALKQTYRNEVTHRIPVRALSTIGTDYPGVDAAKLAAPNGIDPKHISLVGFYVDGKHYVGGCGTRYGTYPYCESLLVPSYSIAKSAFAGLALMRLEKKHPGTRNALVASWVSDCASNGNMFDYVVGLYYMDQKMSSTQQSLLRGFKRWWDEFSGLPGRRHRRHGLRLLAPRDFQGPRRLRRTHLARVGRLAAHRGRAALRERFQ